MKKKSHGPWIAAGIVFAVTVLAFLPVVECAFVNWDDEANFVQNYGYRGWTPGHLHWIFTSFQLGVWQPLSWLLLDIEWSFWGMDPSMHHFVSLLLHALNASLLFILILQLITIPNERPPWRPVLAAMAGSLLYALHPLRVEAVAWMSCQPYLLAMSFSLAALIFYVKSTRSPHPAWKAAAVLAFAGALMSKAIALPLPAALVLLDIWPLHRLALRDGTRAWIRRVFVEKAAFWALTGFAALLAVVGKSHGMQSFEQHALSHRVVQSFYALAFYLWKTIWPTSLSPLYPFPASFHMTEPRFVAGVVFVLLLTAFLIWNKPRFAEGLFAWAIFVVLISPVVGIAQAGPQLAADRYTYLPAWVSGFFVATLMSRRMASDRVMIPALCGCAGVLILFAALSQQQLVFWKDSVSLWKRALEVGPPSVTALNNYGNALIEQGRPADAIAPFAEVIRMNPSHVEAYNNVGIAYAELKDWPHAIQAYQAAIQRNPNYAEGYANLANAFSEIGRPAEAIAAYQRAVVLNPNNPDTFCNLGLTFIHEHRWTEADAAFQKTLQIWPQHANGLYSLAWLRAAAPDSKLRNGTEALRDARKLERLAADNARTHDALAVAWAELGRFDEAQREAACAMVLAGRQQDDMLQLEISRRIKLYREHKPYRMPEK